MLGLIASFFGVAALQNRVPDPPRMPRVPIAPRPTVPGTIQEMEDGDRRFVLFVPDSAKPSPNVRLTIHFHSATWHAIQEHVDRGVSGPVIAYYPGEGSSIYQRSFEDKERFGRWIAKTLEELTARGWPKDAQVESVSLTSFSAGYGAVRELVKQPEAFRMIQRVILADSMYGSLTEPPDRPRVPLAEHVLVWKPLAEAAVRGEKTFVVTYSEVETPTYASSSEMSRALVEACGGRLNSVPPESIPAARDPEFPLKERFDSGRFHVWGYGGKDAKAHMTHARHLADVWKALGAE